MSQWDALETVRWPVVGVGQEKRPKVMFEYMLIILGLLQCI